MRLFRFTPSGFVDSGILILIAAALIGGVSLATISAAQESAVESEKVAEEIVKPVVPPQEIEQPEEKPVDPGELKNVRQQLRDMLRELRRFERLLRKQKLTADLEVLAAVRTKVEQYQKQFSIEPVMRDALQEFHDEQLWDDINTFRCKADIPPQLTQIERELKRLDRQMTAKIIAQTGLDAERLKASVEEMRKALADVRQALAGGNCDDANDSMQTFWQDGKHPGEVMGVIQRLREIKPKLNRIKDEEIRKEISEVLQPVIDSANDGDFREANQALNEIFNELQQLIVRATSQKRFSGFDERLEHLDDLIQQKMGGGTSAPVSSKEKAGAAQ